MTHHVLAFKKLFKYNIELFVRYSPGILHNNTYFTDSNGLNLIKRHYGVSEQFRERPYRLEQNIYPVNRLIFARDSQQKELEFGLVIDRPSGSVYLPTGQVLVHLQRSTFTSDIKGMNEAIQPSHTIHKTHTFYLGSDILSKMRRK